MIEFSNFYKHVLEILVLVLSGLFSLAFWRYKKDVAKIDAIDDKVGMIERDQHKHEMDMTILKVELVTINGRLTENKADLQADIQELKASINRLHSRLDGRISIIKDK